MKHTAATRNGILEYANAEYGTEPGYLWTKFPTYAVLRHSNNGKWYAAIVDVPKHKVGLDGTDSVDLLLVKCDPIMIGSLLLSKGYLPAYHMNKTNWISILLDGTVPLKEAVIMLNFSYDLTQTKRKSSTRKSGESQ